jgi:hypothetical protein
MAFPRLTTEVLALRTTATRVEPVGVQRQHPVANLLAAVDRLDDATAQIVDGIGQARQEGNAMALAIWAVFSAPLSATSTRP